MRVEASSLMEHPGMTECKSPLAEVRSTLRSLGGSSTSTTGGGTPLKPLSYTQGLQGEPQGRTGQVSGRWGQQRGQRGVAVLAGRRNLPWKSAGVQIGRRSQVTHAQAKLQMLTQNVFLLKSGSTRGGQK
eukprot:EG_transcript_34588